MAVIECLSYLIVPYRSLSALWLAAYLTFSYLRVHLAFIILSGNSRYWSVTKIMINTQWPTIQRSSLKIREIFSAKYKQHAYHAGELATLRTHCAVGLASLLKHFTVILQCFFNFSRIHTHCFSVIPSESSHAIHTEQLQTSDQCLRIVIASEIIILETPRPN